MNNTLLKHSLTTLKLTTPLGLTLTGYYNLMEMTLLKRTVTLTLLISLRLRIYI